MTINAIVIVAADLGHRVGFLSSEPWCFERYQVPGGREPTRISNPARVRVGAYIHAVENFAKRFRRARRELAVAKQMNLVLADMLWAEAVQ
jgi:hypothetical protein